MQEKWNEYWKQLLAVEKELNEFLEDGCLSTIAVGKAKKFLSAWNKQKKLASEMDDYIAGGSYSGKNSIQKQSLRGNVDEMEGIPERATRPADPEPVGDIGPGTPRKNIEGKRCQGN